MQPAAQELNQSITIQQHAPLSLEHSAPVANSVIARCVPANDQTTNDTCIARKYLQWSHEDSQVAGDAHEQHPPSCHGEQVEQVSVHNSTIGLRKTSQRKRRLPVNQLTLISQRDDVNLCCVRDMQYDGFVIANKVWQESPDELALGDTPVDPIEESQMISRLELRGPTAPIVALQKPSLDMVRRLVSQCPYKPATLRHKLAVTASPFLLQYGDGFYGPELQLPAKVAEKKSRKPCIATTASLDIVPTTLAAQQQSQRPQIGAEVKRGSASMSNAGQLTASVTTLDVPTVGRVNTPHPTRELYEQLQKVTAPARIPTASTSDDSADESDVLCDDEAVDDASYAAQSREIITTEVLSAADAKPSGITNSEVLFSQQVGRAMLHWSSERLTSL